MMPRSEPKAAPMSVFSGARRMRISKKKIAAATRSPAAAETAGGPGSGRSK
jgi:hypothetical protein